IGHGDRVSVLTHNRPEIFTAWNAVARLGALVVPISYRAAPAEVEYLLTDSASKALIHDASARLTSVPAASAIPCFAVDDPRLRDGPAHPPLDDFLGTPVS